MKTKEEKIIAQFAKIHTKSDWQLFKTVAEYYFKKSATLKKTDIEISDPYKLLIRNIQKRLFLGIATELLIKSCYLKNGYYINKPNDNKKHNSLLLKIKDINKSEFNPDNTFTLGILIDNLDKVIVFTDWKIIKEGLNILRVFRNKEGHRALLWHTFEPQNYKDIENSITRVYKEGFNEKLTFKISMTAKEVGEFSSTK